MRATKELTEKAEIILTGAMKEFLARGYAATSMDRVAATAAVSKATVYSHFRDKEGLFTALVQRLARRKFQKIFGAEHLSELAGEPREILRQFACNMLSQIHQDREYLNFIRLIIGESGRFPELAQIFVRNLAKPGIEMLTEYLASCSQLQLPDPEATARIIVGALVHYLIVQEMLHGKEIIPLESDRLVESLIHLIFPGKETLTR